MRSDLAAYHFCIARNAASLDPILFARSLSQQLSRFDGFAVGILKEYGAEVRAAANVGTNYGEVIAVKIENLTLSAPSATVAFSHAVLEPLKALDEHSLSGPFVIVVDSLDEAIQHAGRETIVSLLANAGDLPRYVRWIVTSRPDGAVLRTPGEPIVCSSLERNGVRII